VRITIAGAHLDFTYPMELAIASKYDNEEEKETILRHEINM
jgi:hypothetical protein